LHRGLDDAQQRLPFLVGEIEPSWPAWDDGNEYLLAVN
jgi:hypothetical protein